MLLNRLARALDSFDDILGNVLDHVADLLQHVALLFLCSDDLLREVTRDLLQVLGVLYLDLSHDCFGSLNSKVFSLVGSLVVDLGQWIRAETEPGGTYGLYNDSADSWCFVRGHGRWRWRCRRGWSCCWWSLVSHYILRLYLSMLNLPVRLSREWTRRDDDKKRSRRKLN